MKKLLSVLILVILVGLGYMLMKKDGGKTGGGLSAEGLKKKAEHDYLFQTYAEGRDTKYVGEGVERGLKELTVLTEGQEIRHGEDLVLPAGTERVAPFFRHLAFTGKNLDLIKEVRVSPFDPNNAPPRSKQVKDFFQVQMPSIQPQEEPFEQMKVTFLMKDETSVSQIESLVFIAQKHISPTFDSIPYLDLGSEFPRERVEILVDTDHELEVGGTSELQREKWFRIHETPGSSDGSLERWAAERGFLPGRGILKFHPTLTVGWGNQEQLKERRDKPGAADLTFFDRYDSAERLKNAAPEFTKPYAMCFNDWPEFMAVTLKGRGTPLVDHFDDATDLAAAYVADQIKDAGATATWWEVKNESSIKSEWDYHWDPKFDGWGLLSDFHNRMADAIHEKAPDVKVGGPSSAYMQVQVQDFGLYRDQARFIEETRGHLDFFSHHFYENAGNLGAHARRDSGYSSYLLGRYEAILDMLRAHMHKVDNVLPILITECGSLQNGRQPSENWLRLCAWSAYLNKSMQRPDQIDAFVPFVFLNMHWNPNNGDAAFAPKPGVKRGHKIEDFNPTDTAYFLELWRDFNGRRLPVSFQQDWLDVTAVHDGDRISLAVTNMGGRQLSLDLSALAKKMKAQRATQTRLNYHQGQVEFLPEHEVKASSIPVDVNETTIVRLILNAPLQPQGQLKQERFYAAETAVKSDGAAASFQVNVNQPENVQSARLLIGIHSKGGLTEPLAVEVNGEFVTVDTGDAHEFTEFFAPIDADLPLSLLKDETQLKIKAQAGATITSVQILTQSSL